VAEAKLNITMVIFHVYFQASYCGEFRFKFRLMIVLRAYVNMTVV
jgi:aromatic ring-cleaving dioxygenase